MQYLEGHFGSSTGPVINGPFLKAWSSRFLLIDMANEMKIYIRFILRLRSFVRAASCLGQRCFFEDTRVDEWERISQSLGTQVMSAEENGVESVRWNRFHSYLIRPRLSFSQMLENMNAVDVSVTGESYPTARFNIWTF